MDAPTRVDLHKEIDAFLAEHPGTASVDLLLTDLNGIMRGKRVTPDKLKSVADGSLQLPASTFASNITGDSVEETGLVWDTGDSDSDCFLIPGSLMATPWREKASAQMLIAMHGDDGAPFYGDPRAVLKKVADRFAERGWTPVIALELEFYLFDIQRGENEAPQAAKSPRSGQRQETTQVYGLDELDDFQGMLDAIDNAVAAQGLPVDTASAEYSPGQFEINLKHVTDPLLAADHAQLLKRTIKNVARAHGMEATFMAKPLAENSGNGLHIHCSLLDEDGNNLFAKDGDILGSDMLRHAIGGLFETMDDTMAILAPNANSFRRLQPNSYVPLTPCWGHNNRTVAFRIPKGPIAATRFEHRVAGADANPYLVTAAVLAAVLHGIDNKCDPGAPITGNAYEVLKPTIAETWKDAIERFEQSPFTKDVFGAEFHNIYTLVKTNERRLFDAAITPLEWHWYLKTV